MTMAIEKVKIGDQKLATKVRKELRNLMFFISKFNLDTYNKQDPEIEILEPEDVMKKF